MTQSVRGGGSGAAPPGGALNALPHYLLRNTPGPSAPARTYGSGFFFPRMAVFDKPHLSVADQIELLQARGLEITDPAKTRAALQRIGYYRLAEYWHPMRRTTTGRNARGKTETIVLDAFKPGARFADVLDLYVFDKRLRLLMLDAIERVEIALRVDCAHRLGARDPYLHRDWRALDPAFVQKDHAIWLSRVDAAAAKSRGDLIAEFLQAYDPPLPLWVSIECWDFGMLSYFVGGLRTPDKTAMAAHWGLPRRDLLTSWIRAINNLRNICAHYGRLWNRVLVDMPSPPKIGESPLLDHLARRDSPQNRLYSVAAALQWFLRSSNPRSSWPTRLAAHFATFPTSSVLDRRATGFPTDWDALPLWT